MDNDELQSEMHTVDPGVARAGALFGAKMQEALETHLGRTPSIDETRDFALGAMDIIFSATYSLVYIRENPPTAHSWTEAVMQCISDSVKTITRQDFKITILSKDPS